MCMRIPVPNEEEMQWMRSGQPLFSLIAEAFEEQKKKKSGEPTPAAEEAPKDAVEAMNTAMDDLEALFGFGDAPAPKEEEPVEEDYEPLVKEDTKFDPLMYHYKDSDYLMTPSRDHAIQFCPFCGSKGMVIGRMSNAVMMSYYAACSYCGCELHKEFSSQQTAISEWNRRA